MPTLRESLTYEPVELRFGTSGRRGEVIHLTQLEVYINVLAEVEYLLSLPHSEGGIERGHHFYIGHDLRPSSTQFAPEFGGRGEILQAARIAVDDAGMKPVTLGAIPTPALMYHAHRCGSIMVTGSHIPFDRNGYKTNSSRGELRKQDEGPILECVADVRKRICAEPAEQSRFDGRGMLKRGHIEVGSGCDLGAKEYLARYRSFFPSRAHQGLHLLVYQHSAVGRDLLATLLRELGADVVAAGRSETFVPIDTESIEAATLQEVARLAREAGAEFDAVVSTDGDSDRPLILGFEPDGTLRFFPGDLVGMVTAEYLGADAVVVPVSCNDGIEIGPLRDKLQPRTKIGSPYVIAGMERAVTAGKTAVCGWEANGGFLLGSRIERDGRVLEALPTRDAFLPILSVLHAAQERRVSLVELFDALPARHSRAGLLRQFPRQAAQAIIAALSPAGAVEDVSSGPEFDRVVRNASSVLSPELGFGRIVRINYLDGVRVWFDNGDIAHIRPSGNADEFRIYAVANSRERAEEIVRLGVAEPDGLLRKLEATLL